MTTYATPTKSTTVRFAGFAASLAERLAPSWVEEKAFALWGKPQRPAARWGAVSATARRFELDVGDRALPAWEWNVGGPRGSALLVHGWSGNASQLGSFVAPLVSLGWHVVAIDLPAHGEAAGDFCTLPLMAQVVASVGVRLRPSVVIAHSLGATATAYALTKGLEVQRVALLAPPARMTPYLTHFTQLVGLSLAMRDRLVSRVERYINAPISELDLIAHAPRLGATKALVVHDVSDAVVPVASAHELVAAWPGARLIETTGLSHDRVRRDTAVVSDVVEFVTGQRLEVAPTAAPVVSFA